MTAKPKLLLVDDEPIWLRSLIRTFRGAWDIRQAEDGAVALLLEPGIGGWRPDAVLTDWNMPEGGGQRVVAECRRLGIPVIVHSANTELTLDCEIVLKGDLRIEGALRRALERRTAVDCQSEHKGLAQKAQFDKEQEATVDTQTASGKFIVYHRDEAGCPEDHAQPREWQGDAPFGPWFFQPTDYDTAEPYSIGYPTKKEAREAAECTELDLQQEQEDDEARHKEYEEQLKIDERVENEAIGRALRR